MEHCDRLEFAAALVRVVALHDEETATHLRATAALARRIASRMDVAPTTIEQIELSALLHDIGKIRVARDILCKRGALTEHEWIEMRLHAETGAGVLADTPILADLAPAVRAHHERIDGTGYPARLKGEEIPLEARVVAVADALHALTTDRPYRAAVGRDAALAVLAGAAGTQFDVDVVAATVDAFAPRRASRRLSA